ncbi:MAG: hypothetical protein RSD30_12300, partial [Flavobacterium sp.]
MKNTFMGLVGLLFFSTVSYGQVGVGTLTPEQSSQLDVTATNKGILIPRIKLTQISSQAPVVGTAAVSLLVYNTQSINDVTPGFYYWNGVKWVRIISKDEIGNFQETVTTLVNNGNGTYTYSSEDGKITTVEVAKDVKSYQTLTSLVYNSSTQVLTYKDENEKSHEITLEGLTGPQGLPGKDGQVGTAAGAGAPGDRGSQGYPGEGVNIYTDNSTGDVYVQNADGTWTKINGENGENGKNGQVGLAGGNGAPGDKGSQGYPGEGVNIYTDNSTGDVYVQNADGTWTKINGENGENGKNGQVGLAGGNGAPGDKGSQGYPGEGVNVYTDNSTGDVYVQNADGTWTKINGENGKDGIDGKDGQVGTAAGSGAPGVAGTPGAPGKDINIYTDIITGIVYVQNSDGTWTPINGKDGQVGTASGAGAPGDRGSQGYPGEGVNIYTDNSTGDVYVQNADGTWTKINGENGENGKNGQVGLAGGNGAPGDKGSQGYPGEGVNIYTDNSTGDVYVQNADGTWTKINGENGENGKNGQVGLAGGNGAPGDKGSQGYPGEGVNVYTDNSTGDVYVQNADGT